MTPEEIGKMTIDELEKAASRVSAALSVLREAGAWRPAEQVPMHLPCVDSKPAQISPDLPTVRFSAQEMAERARLLKQLRPELPDDIAAAEST